MCTYIQTYFLQKWSPINSIEVHPQLSHSGHPVDDELVGASSCALAASIRVSTVSGLLLSCVPHIRNPFIIALEDCEANHYWAVPRFLLLITLFFFAVFCLDDLFDFFSFFGVLALPCVPSPPLLNYTHTLAHSGAAATIIAHDC